MFEFGCWFLMAALLAIQGFQGMPSLSVGLISPLLILVIYWLRKIANTLAPQNKL